MLTRRSTLLGLTALATARVKFALAAAATDQRFVVVLLRGALDGMSAVVPYGDSNLVTLRPLLIPPAVGTQGGMYDLGGFFGLNPDMPNIYALYQSGEALPIHAVAGPYRTRSHFEAQDLLQLGIADEGSINSGWLNRVLAELPANPGPALTGLAAGLGTPLLLQGPVPVGSYVNGHLPSPSPELYAKIAALNAQDPLTGPAIYNGLREQSFDASVAQSDAATQMAAAPAANIMSDDAGFAKGDLPKKAGGFPAIALQVGQLLAAPDGPRIAAFQLEGWDTHGNQVGGLKGPLAGLDAGLAALKTGLGPAWNSTMVVVMTEFGRTAAMNGTKGTDHGTATAAFILGGQVKGGRVCATWPGLADNQLFENRDLAPSLDIRSVAKGALASHLGLDHAALARVFPGSTDAAPLNGLRRTA